MKVIYYDRFDAPIGRLWAATTTKGLCKVSLTDNKEEFLANLNEAFDGRLKRGREPFTDLFHRFEVYFRGEPTSFSNLPMDVRGTDFQRGVWRAVAGIPYGRLSTYREIAVRVGRPRAYRAVGNAVGKNPLLIVVPCHRVIRSNGSLGGFGGRIEIKKYLLKLEGLEIY